MDGVSYEDLKAIACDNVLVNIANVVRMNQRLPAAWKHCLIYQIPKKNFNIHDLSTLRDISLLPTLYKILIFESDMWTDSSTPCRP